MALTDKLTSIADVIRLRTGNTNKMTLDEMANTVGKMSDCSNDTVTPGALALGVTAHDKTGALITGTLAVDCGYGPNDLVAGTTPLAAGSYYFLVNEAHRSVGNVYVGDENGVASLWAEREIHDWAFVERIDPSCTVDGCDLYSCNCGETKRENVIAAAGHSYTSVVTAPTCTAQGYTTHTCSKCGDSYKDAYTAVAGHKYGTAYLSSEFSTGYGQKCSVCGHLNALVTKKISTLSVGSSVYVKVNGTRTQFIVVQQGRPSTAYNTSCDGTWLLMKGIYEKRAWHSEGAYYVNSDIHSYLNSTFVNKFDSGVRSILKNATLPYPLFHECEYMTARVFLLSYPEVGFGDLDGQGAVLSYFSGAGNSKRIAYYGSSSYPWHTRTNAPGGIRYVYSVSDSGAATSTTLATYNYGIRPAIILPSNTLVDASGNVIA